MIPLRLIDSLVIAWPARRFRSNWMAVIVHSVEGVGLLALVVMGVMSPPLEPLPTLLTFPRISRRPIPVNYERGVTTSLPAHDPDSDEIWQVDLRSYDLSALDLRDASNDLFYANFDSRTLWPPDDRMHPGFDPEQILELGKNPGLGLRRLHAQGITGRGTGIAIIDLPLLTEHQEYADQLQWYEEIVTYPFEQVKAEMHGATVASIAVGKTVGVAPEASLYYIASGYPYMPFHHDGEGMRRILQINEQLPEDQKIRVISISCYCDFPDVIAEEAKAAGMLIVCSSIEEVHGFEFHGLGRSPMADPDIFESYEPGMFWAERFYAGGHRFSDHLLVPMDSRTTASPTGIDEYAFYRHGGVSWSIPYIAGVYALAAQVDPTITPGRFWSLALETGRTIDIEHEGQMFTLDKILDPVALINTLQND